MVRHAESDEKKKQREREAKAALQKEVVEAYQEELARRKLGLPSIGAKAICKRYAALHRTRTGETIKLNHATIINHAKGNLLVLKVTQFEHG
jgi:hypothetical protein